MAWLDQTLRGTPARPASSSHYLQHAPTKQHSLVPKLIFLCSYTNPTGWAWSSRDAIFSNSGLLCTFICVPIAHNGVTSDSKWPTHTQRYSPGWECQATSSLFISIIRPPVSLLWPLTCLTRPPGREDSTWHNMAAMWGHVYMIYHLTQLKPDTFSVTILTITYPWQLGGFLAQSSPPTCWGMWY